MMEKKYLKYASIFIICILIGVGIVAAAGVSAGQMLYVSKKTVKEYETQIESEFAAMEKIEMQIQEKNELLNTYICEMENNENNTALDKLAQELANYKIMTGTTDVHGEGVIIIVDDGTRPLYEGEDINNLLVHDADILMIINELKKCKAEAISVNGHRITPNTYISCSGYTIRMDGMVYARPFEIKAIGDSKRISNLLLSPDGYGTSLKNWGVQFSLEVAPDIIIKAADNEKNYRYAKPVENLDMLSEMKKTEKENE